MPPPTNPPQKLTGSYYGSMVGISGDLLVMGGPQADVADEEEGAVLVFRHEGASWAYQDTLIASEGGSYDHLGAGLDVHNGVVLAGAMGHDALGSNVGAAYLFVIEGGEPSLLPNQSPTASFTYECIEFACSFDASVSSDPDGSIEMYSWDFGDGSDGKGVVVSHEYAYSGAHTVHLTVTDDDGALDTTTQTVTIAGDSDVPGLAFQGLGHLHNTIRESAAYGVSADGSTIVGFGVNPAGQTEAWLCTVGVCYDLILPDGVGIVDVQVVAGRWGLQIGDPDWDSRFDLDGDGVITVVDITLVAEMWYRSCP